MPERIDVELKILIVAEHASLKFGGEAALPLHYFRVLRQRKFPAWLVVHARTRDELEAAFLHDQDRITYISDTLSHRVLWKLGRLLPARLASFTTGFLMRCMTQLTQRRIIRRLVLDQKISVIHQPMPVSPKEPSMLYGLGVPVVIGPMNGGMEYPPAFRRMQSIADRLGVAIGRRIATLMNTLIPGKRQAAILLVANERTRAALPAGIRGLVKTIVENGVDLNLWVTPTPLSAAPHQSCTRFAYVGRLVDWKAIDKLLVAFKRARGAAQMKLMIIGDGAERQNLEQITRNLELWGKDSDQSGSVSFLGWMSQTACAAQLQKCDVLVLPSLLECGGAVVLEAMAMGIPVIATAWGGPADYLDESCGILVEPTSVDAFITNLSTALIRLAKNPEERIAMGKAGRRKVVEDFDWEAKVDRMLGIYREAIERSRANSLITTKYD
jgi:glycosyltransferase involved in cell wall biosynthesis